MGPTITEKTFRQIIEEISDHHHPMSGFAIAAAATQAAALAEACMQISLDNQVDKLNWQDVTNRIGQMAHFKDTLLEWCNQHTSQIEALMARVNHQAELNSYQLLCEHLAEISALSVQGASLLREFRPLVFEEIRDDLELSFQLLLNTAQAALLLVERNLRYWPGETVNEYAPRLVQLNAEISRLKADSSS
jgi:hypothetical protein